VTCPAPEVLLLHAEGEHVSPVVAAHIAGCGECRAMLAEVGRFEAQIATETATTVPAEERARLRATPVPLRRASPRRLVVFALVGLAAALVLVFVLPWSRAELTVDVRRYDPSNVVRAESLERFSLTVTVGAPRWLALWQLDGPAANGGAAKRLVPHADPLLGHGARMPLPAGEHRVPSAEVLDFEFATAAPPSALLLVTTEREPAEAELVAIERLIETTPRDQLAAAVQRAWPESRVVPFPVRAAR
jgi:hypothetical protein